MCERVCMSRCVVFGFVCACVFMCAYECVFVRTCIRICMYVYIFVLSSHQKKKNLPTTTVVPKDGKYSREF